jgi:crossover junction endodeoxyribonuclease RusA
MTEIILPWPASILNPNNRAHWTKKAKAKAAARQDGFYLAKQTPIKIEGTVHLFLTFWPPTKRHYDGDNLLASCKAILDGLADGWNVNDKCFRPITIVFGPIVKHGKVVVRI